MTLTRMEIGLIGEKKGLEILKRNGFEVYTPLKQNLSHDLIAEKNKRKYFINVKTGKTMAIPISNIKGLLKEDGIPAFLFVIDENAYLFVLDELFIQEDKFIRVGIRIPKKLDELIEKYRQEEHFSSWTSAVISLIVKGLKAYKEERRKW